MPDIQPVPQVLDPPEAPPVVEKSRDILRKDQEKAGYYDEDAHEWVWIPYGITSFAALDAYRNAEEASTATRKAAREFFAMVENIMDDLDVDDKSAAVRNLAQEFMDMVDENMGEMEEAATKSVGQRALTFTKNLLGLTPQPNPDQGGLLIYKDKDSGEIHWLARYSNNFRDDDYPPEIISKESHERFVAMVDKGFVPLPELWLWHNPKWVLGKARWVAWDAVNDEVGFALAGGVFYPQAEPIAEKMRALPLVGVSHGMPEIFIGRTDKDQSIITQHITTEISPLPPQVAANRIAAFAVLKEAPDMTIETQKRATLKEEWNLTDPELDALEQLNQTAAAKAIQEGTEFKAKGSKPMADDEDDEDEKTASKKESEPVVGESPAEPVQPEPQTAAPLTVDNVSEAIKQILEPLQTEIQTLATRVKELEEAEAPPAEPAQNKDLPTASVVSQIVQSVVGRPETQVDGRTALAKQAPAENKAAAPNGAANHKQVTNIPFIDRIIGEAETKRSE